MSVKKGEMLTAGILNSPQSAAQMAITKVIIDTPRKKKQGGGGKADKRGDWSSILHIFNGYWHLLVSHCWKMKSSLSGRGAKICLLHLDPTGVRLYTLTSNILKGSKMLPMLRYAACGYTSLESFHLHLKFNGKRYSLCALPIQPNRKEIYRHTDW